MMIHVFSPCCRDFAYVARDKNTRVLKCHVFRCDTPAAAIATSLHEICSKVGLICHQCLHTTGLFLCNRNKLSSREHSDYQRGKNAIVSFTILHFIHLADAVIQNNVERGPPLNKFKF